jgi:predicted RNA-binding Zn ribbon-like protein
MPQKKKRDDRGGSTLDSMASARMRPVHVGPLAPRVCLDFANSLDNRLAKHPQESFTNYADLVSWSQRAGVLAQDAAQSLTQQAAVRPAAAAKVLARAMALREAFYRIFSAVASQRSPQTADLDLLNDILGEALAVLRITSTADGFAWDWISDVQRLDRLLWPIAQSAADLLTCGELQKVRECAAPTCGWLFLDTSRNHSRRWCDMNACGNRAKARRHYERTKKALEKASSQPNRH